MKLVRREWDWDGKHFAAYYVYCPACERAHRFIVENEENPEHCWEFSGELDWPTFRPSLLVNCGPLKLGGRDEVCHSYLRNGVWRYLGDSTHKLANHHTPMVDFPENYRV